MYKILILAYLIGSDPVISQQNFEMQGWYKTMQECQANLLKQHPDQTYEVMREFVEDTNFKFDWLVAGCTNEETGEKYMVFPDYPNGKPKELEGLEFELQDIVI
tara:strand:- start:1983 stop:2294 length:312 start_codon:yes stop_codon:yes gene_type:complete